jgi:hypothetical protein
VVLEPVPWIPDRLDPLVCLSTAATLEECRYVAPTTPTGLEQLYRELDADDDQVWAADLDQLVCPFLPICDPIVNREVVRTDRSHLTPPFAETLAPAVWEYLRTNGVLGRR